MYNLRFFQALLTLVALVARGTCQSFSLDERLQMAKYIMKETPLIDGHNDLPYNLKVLVNNKLENVELNGNLQEQEPWKSDKYSHTNIPRLRQGSLGAQFWVDFLPCDSQELNSVQLALDQIDVIKRMVKKYPDHFEFVDSSQGIRDAFGRNKIASLIGLEGGHMIRSSLATLRMMYELGTRYMTLTHSCDTPWATSSPSEKEGKDKGLSDFGEKVVLEMNRLGMMVDISHVSAKTMRDAIRISSAPVIFSHSGVRAICDHHRNVPDDVLEKLKGNGGIVMVTFYDKHIKCDGNSTLNDVVDHINHIRNVAGVDHVGIGGDYDGVSRLPKGLEDPSKYPDLIAELLKDPKWTTENIKKLIGENLLRVFKQVENIRDKLQSSGTKAIEDSLPARDRVGFANCSYFAYEEESPLTVPQYSINRSVQLQANLFLFVLMLFQVLNTLIPFRSAFGA